MNRKEYDKLKAVDVVGRKVRILRDLKNGNGSVPVGTIMEVVDKHSGYALKGDFRDRRGRVFFVTKVPPEAVELVEEAEAPYHHTVKWAIYKGSISDPVRELDFRVHAEEDVPDGHYPVECYVSMERNRAYGVEVKDGLFVPEPTMEAVYQARKEAYEPGVKFPCFLEKMVFEPDQQVFLASIGT